MWPGIVVVEKIPLQNTSKLHFGKYNHVVETLAANTAEQAFGVWILPGRMWGGDHFFDPHSSYPQLKIVSVDRIPIS